MSRLVYACVALVVASVGISSCRCNPKYCEGALDNNCDNLTDGPQRCTSNEGCAEPTAVCDVAGSMTCVQCTPDQAGACSGTTPACGEDHACRACRAHAECPGSNACLPDGSCADPNQVAYVKPISLGGTDNPNCALATPCTKVTNAMATFRPYIKFAGTTDEGGTISIDNRNVMLLAEPDAKLIRTSNGLIVEIKGTSQVEIYDLQISGASGVQGIGISMPTGNTAKLTMQRVRILNNTGGGISTSGGTLAVSQSTISGNAGGGISASGATLTFVIVGNVFYQNGSLSSLVGGVSLSSAASSTNRLEFNSFNKNTTADAVAPAIQCVVASGFLARNNIMSGNLRSSDMEQVGGNCMHAYSIVRPGTVPSGTGNSGMDPLFVNTMTGDLHVKAGSPALGAADPSSDLTGPAERDIDGDVRTSRADIGADEVR